MTDPLIPADHPSNMPLPLGGPPAVADLPGAPIDEVRRRPLIDAAGRSLLRTLLEHPHAPRYNHTCGDRLTAPGLAEVRALDAETFAGPAPSISGADPPWMPAFIAHCQNVVPIYRTGGQRSSRLNGVPTVDRSALVFTPWAFVPDDHPLHDLVVFTTTGTTDGRAAYVVSTPQTAAAYGVMLRAALRVHGVVLEGGPGRTAVAQVCWQRRTFTYAAISSYFDQAALLKINLNPDDWRDPDDRVAFLDSVEAQVITGDPVAFTRLAELPLAIEPVALVSTAMTLLDGLRDRLVDRFGCPVIDVYGMNEAGPIAAALSDGSGHVMLQPRLHVEILDGAGRRCPDGERGEITLTGGFNPALPLLRYRTGDFASREVRGGSVVLVGLSGRAPVAFASLDGRAVNTIDITVAMRRQSLARYTVHQRADRSLEIGLDGGRLAGGFAGETEVDVRVLLAELFGPVPVTVRALDGEPEAVTYSSDRNE